jgi:hypothetical protein
MPTIRALRIHAVELAHPLREIAIRGLNHQMIVIAHQAVGVTQPVEILDHRSQNIQKSMTVFVVLEDPLLAVAPRRNVVERTRKLKS